MEKYSAMLPEHEKSSGSISTSPSGNPARQEMLRSRLRHGRWSYFLSKFAKEIILVDFFRFIFVARENLKGKDNCLFFMGDIKKLPSGPISALHFFSGVLHHLPTPAWKK